MLTTTMPQAPRRTAPGDQRVSRGALSAVLAELEPQRRLVGAGEAGAEQLRRRDAGLALRPAGNTVALSYSS